MLKDRGWLRVVLWLLVICTGFKSIQATYMFFSFARAMNPRPESLLSHEESVFFGIFMVLTVGLWVYGHRGPHATGDRVASLRRHRDDGELPQNGMADRHHRRPHAAVDRMGDASGEAARTSARYW